MDKFIHKIPIGSTNIGTLNTALETEPAISNLSTMVDELNTKIDDNKKEILSRIEIKETEMITIINDYKKETDKDIKEYEEYMEGLITGYMDTYKKVIDKRVTIQNKIIAAFAIINIVLSSCVIFI